ncbi:MAG TPA: hypothetical protein VE954_04900 [Oligoflexus sp.]|uniref:hypothetical protein n=1 Tax=Oligoflexus sp. TaxID=1971216 RepID=UPI002D274899|nr:hypothetical protein [Oligoflexus sp.]HYX32430.1 hypothetical protein [Oligoflexus sp.]
MANHPSYLERLIHRVDHISGRADTNDPFQRFRWRAFVVMLIVLAFICLLQAITAWLSGQAPIVVMTMLILFFLIIISLILTRRSARIDATASWVLIFLVLMGALLEFGGGRSPNTPMIYWSTVMIFGGYVFCGLKRGTLVAIVLIVSTMAVIMVPLAFDHARILPGGSDEDSYRRRLFVTVLLCHFLPLCLLGMYENFFKLCHDEARALLDKVEGRKDRAFLSRLARLITDEMDPELRRMELAYHNLHKGGDVLKMTADVLEPLQRLVHLTRRYEPLSIGALAAVE